MNSTTNVRPREGHSSRWSALLVFTLAVGSVAAAEPTKPLPITTVDFERHVAPLLTRLGCNAGACHGSFEGQGGFRLSLFGQSPAKDFAAIAGDLQARRVVVAAPDESLILTKPSTRVDHEGGLRLPEASWQYALIRRWIGEGARYDSGRGELRRLVLRASPGAAGATGAEEQKGLSHRLARGDALALSAAAEFADGAVEDITAFSELRSSDETVANVGADGRVSAIGPGSASIIAAYGGALASTSIIVPYAPAGALLARSQPANLIDVEIDRQLDQLGLASSPLAADSEFLRRATLDVLGTLPTVDEVHGFLADHAPNKRQRAIERLLAHPRRAAVWATKMCDITGCNLDTLESPEQLRPKRAKMWHDWFRRRFQENMPYDELARGVLCATSRAGEPIERWVEQEAARQDAMLASFDSDYARRPSLDLYWRRVGRDGPPPVEDLAELTASAFLGLRLHCARCHHHPYDRWAQRDFAGFAQIVARVQFGASTELRTEINRQLEHRRQRRAEGVNLPALPRLQEVYVAERGRALVDAAPEADAPPTAPGGPVLAGPADPRQSLTDWLTQPDNPFFAASFVNRLWAKYFGTGLVEPVDDMSAANPASHPVLLERLAAEFVRSRYDIAHLERLMLSSNAYQRSALPAGNNAADSSHFARAPVRPLPAETLIDALNAALETSDNFGSDVPPGGTAYDVAPNRLSGTDFDAVFRLLGRGDRRSLCDCDRAVSPSIRQPIFLMSDPRVLEKINTGRLTRLLEATEAPMHSSTAASNCVDAQIITELFVATLSRLPDAAELEFLLRQVSTAADRRAALADVLWALLNTREFSTNH